MRRNQNLSSSLIETEQILGIRFFNGTAAEAVRRAAEGGLVVAPSGTCFERFATEHDYRRAILTADVVLPDSGLMVSLWRLLCGRRIHRLSGLAYLKEFLTQSVATAQRILWVLPNEKSRTRFLEWAAGIGHGACLSDRFLAPIYGAVVKDKKLLARIEAKHSSDVVIAIGAGAQEKLGWYLRENASSPAAVPMAHGSGRFGLDRNPPPPSTIHR